MDNQPTRTYCITQELCSILCGSLDGRGVWGRMDTCICTAEFLLDHLKLSQHWLLISSTSIQNKKPNKKKHWFLDSIGLSHPKVLLPWVLLCASEPGSKMGREAWKGIWTSREGGEGLALWIAEKAAVPKWCHLFTAISKHFKVSPLLLLTWRLLKWWSLWFRQHYATPLLGEAHWLKPPTLARHHSNHLHELFYDRRSW